MSVVESWEFGCGILRFWLWNHGSLVAESWDFGCGIVGVWLWNRENVVVEARRLWLGNRVVWFWNRVVLVLESWERSCGIALCSWKLLNTSFRGVGRFGDLYLSCHPCITTTHLSYSFLCLKLPPPRCVVLLVCLKYLRVYSYSGPTGRLNPPDILRNWYEDVVGARVGESRDLHLVGKNSHDTRYLWYLLYDRHASTSTQGI